MGITPNLCTIGAEIQAGLAVFFNAFGQRNRISARKVGGALAQALVALARAALDSRRQIERDKREAGLARRGAFERHDVLVALGAGL